MEQVRVNPVAWTDRHRAEWQKVKAAFYWERQFSPLLTNFLDACDMGADILVKSEVTEAQPTVGRRIQLEFL